MMLEIVTSIDTTIWLLIAASIAYIFYRSLTKQSSYWEKQGVPCIKPGVQAYINLYMKPLNIYEQEHYKKLGRVYGRYDGSQAVLTVGDPDLLRNILVKDFHIFQNRRDVQFGDPVLDNNVSILSGENWKRVRSIMTPTFTSGKLRRMVPQLHDCAKPVMEILCNAEKSGSSVDLERLCGSYSLDVIASCAFGTKINSLKDPNNPFVVNAKQIFQSGFPWRAFLTVFFPFIMKLFRISMLNPVPLKFFSEFTSEIIKERKRQNQEGTDYLQLLLNAEECDSSQIALSHDELTAQCILFFMAGYDSVSSIVQHTFYSMATNEAIQEKLLQEIDEKLEGKKDIEYDDFMNLKYLDSVISESLRLSGSCIRMERQVESDYTLGDTGILLKKGQLISLPIYCIHHDPKWYSDPEKFDPERFTAEEKAARHPFVYLPFGLGPRSCIGNRFAFMEIKLLIVKILRYYRVLTSPETEIPLGFRVKQGSLVPNKVMLRFKARRSGETGQLQ